MAFEQNFFNPVGGQSRTGNSQAIWNYRHNSDNLFTIRMPGYFNFLRDMVVPNDVVKIIDNVGAFQLAFFGTVPKSPSMSDVTLSALKVDAS